MADECFDVVIVGAGHNGLVCAGYLAKAGLRVLVLERAAQVGGACITQELIPGFRFSTFAYAAHGPGAKICRDLEIPSDAFHIVTPDPEMIQLYPDGDRLILWRDPSRVEEEIARFSLRDARRYAGFREFCSRAIRICTDFFLEEPISPAELERKWNDPAYADVLDIMLHGSLWDIICRYFDDEKVRVAFARADDAGPTNHPGSALAEFVECGSSGLGVKNQSGLLRGGMGHVTGVLAQRVAAYGGEIRVNAPVCQILIERGVVVGVELESGERVAARMVVSNADPKRTFLKLISTSNLDPAFRESVVKLKTRASYMKFHAALNDFPHFKGLQPNERDNPKLASGARIVPSLAYMEESWQDCINGRFPRNLILSMQLPTAYWPSQAPPGKHIFGAWVRWGTSRLSDGSSWEERRQELTEQILGVVEGYAPGFARSVEWCRLYTPADIERETGISDASIRHVDMILDQMLNRRPLPGWSDYRTPVKGLWLCGSGTHPCGSVTGGPGHNCAAGILRSSGLDVSRA